MLKNGISESRYSVDPYAVIDNADGDGDDLAFGASPDDWSNGSALDDRPQEGAGCGRLADDEAPVLSRVEGGTMTAAALADGETGIGLASDDRGDVDQLPGSPVAEGLAEDNRVNPIPDADNRSSGSMEFLNGEEGSDWFDYDSVEGTAAFATDERPVDQLDLVGRFSSLAVNNPVACELVLEATRKALEGMADNGVSAEQRNAGETGANHCERPRDDRAGNATIHGDDRDGSGVADADADTFVFASGEGNTVIAGLDPTAGVADAIEPVLGAEFDTRVEVMAGANEVGQDAVFAFDGNDQLTSAPTGVRPVPFGELWLL